MRLRRHTRAGHDEDSHGIDLAPMLDFVLNLLIFFIITAVFVKATAAAPDSAWNAEAFISTGDPSDVLR